MIAESRRVSRQWTRLTPGHHVEAVWRYRRAVVVLTILGGAGAALVSVLQTPMYGASIQLFMSPNLPAANASQLNEASSYILQRVRSYAQIANSPQLAAAAIDRLALPYRPEELMARITVSSQAGTAVLTIKVVDPSPDRARKIADVIADEFPGFVDRLETPSGAGRSPVKVSVVRAATTPRQPDSPRTRTNIALGMVGGLVIGAVAAVVRFTRDASVRSPRHAAALAGADLLGTVPDEAAPVDTRAGPDPYRHIRTGLRLHAAGRQPTGIAVTAVDGDEGRSVVAANLAIAYARAGETVVLLDGDPRPPRVHELFGLPDDNGLASVLRKETECTDPRYRWRPDLPLYLLTCSCEPPEEQLLADELPAIVESLRGGGIVVVVDVPPLLAEPEAATLVSAAGTTVLVARVGSTRADRLAAAAVALDAMGAAPLGVIAVATGTASRGQHHGRHAL